MDKKTTAPGKLAHYYALMAWNGMNAQDAGKMVSENSYETLNATTYAGDSVNAAKSGIEKHLAGGKVVIDPAQITGDAPYNQSYFYAVGDKIVANFDSEEQLCDSIIKVIEEIHNKWVEDNAKKYNRDQDKNDKRLYQHLPTALIGIDEVAKDLMFLAPILEKTGYKVGTMTESEWGAFVPSQAIVEAYQRYVAKYKADNHIANEEDLAKHIANITSTYDPLKVKKVNNPNDPKEAEKNRILQERIDYMSDKNRVNVLVGQVKAKNEQAFGKDQAQPS